MMMMTNDDEGCLQYALTLESARRFVAFQPLARCRHRDGFLMRRNAIGKFAVDHGLSRVLLDYRGQPIPLEPGVVDAILQSDRLRVPGAWRIAILVSADMPTHVDEMAGVLVELLRALGQNSARFLEYDAAAEWLAGTDEVPA